MITLLITLICSVYFANAEVVEVTETDVIFVTDDGNEWAINGNGYEVGDKITVKMHTNYTENITDDRVLNIYSERR